MPAEPEGKLPAVENESLLTLTCGEVAITLPAEPIIGLDLTATKLPPLDNPGALPPQDQSDCPSVCISQRNSHLLNASNCFLSSVASMQPSSFLGSSFMSITEPQCRICQGLAEPNLGLISPCRCAGSLKYIHGKCLRKWMECSHSNPNSRNRHGAPTCELCGYTFIMKKKFKLSNFQYPAIPICDRLLHTIFIVCLFIMLVCGMMALLLARFTHFAPSPTSPSPTTTLGVFDTTDSLRSIEKIGKTRGKFTETISVVGAAICFVCFFIGLLSECKAKRSICHLIQEFIKCNQVWVIQNYDRARDKELR